MWHGMYVKQICGIVKNVIKREYVRMCKSNLETMLANNEGILLKLFAEWMKTWKIVNFQSLRNCSYCSVCFFTISMSTIRRKLHSFCMHFIPWQRIIELVANATKSTGLSNCAHILWKILLLKDSLALLREHLNMNRCKMMWIFDSECERAKWGKPNAETRYY